MSDFCETADLVDDASSDISKSEDLLRASCWVVVGVGVELVVDVVMYRTISSDLPCHSWIVLR